MSPAKTDVTTLADKRIIENNAEGVKSRYKRVRFKNILTA
jgi:hypothetical protein